MSKYAPQTTIKAKRKPNDNKVNGICAVEACNKIAFWEHPCCSEKCEKILIDIERVSKESEKGGE